MGREDRLFVSQFSESRHRVCKLTARSTALGVREQLLLWLLGSYYLRYPVVRRLRLMKCKSFSSEAAFLQRILISNRFEKKVNPRKFKKYVTEVQIQADRQYEKEEQAGNYTA